jgi:hypothetical protein
MMRGGEYMEMKRKETKVVIINKKTFVVELRVFLSSESWLMISLY